MRLLTLYVSERHDHYFIDYDYDGPDTAEVDDLAEEHLGSTYNPDDSAREFLRALRAYGIDNPVRIEDECDSVLPKGWLRYSPDLLNPAGE